MTSMRAVAALACVLAVAGCGVSGQGTSGSFVAGSQVPAHGAEEVITGLAAHRVLADALAALRADATGRVEIRSSHGAGQGALSQVSVDQFDLATDGWAMTYTARGPGVEDEYGGNMKAVSVDGRDYLSFPENPTSPDMWVSMPRSATGEFDTTSRAAVAALDRVVVREVRTYPRGSTVLGTIPAADVVTMLQLTPEEFAGVEPHHLGGDADIEVDVDRRGNLTGVLVRGDDVRFSSAAVPPDLRALVAASRATFHFSELGADVDVEVPRSHVRLSRRDLAELDLPTGISL